MGDVESEKKSKRTNSEVAETALSSEELVLVLSCEVVTRRKFVSSVGRAAHSEAPPAMTARTLRVENHILNLDTKSSPLPEKIQDRKIVVSLQTKQCFVCGPSICMNLSRVEILSRHGDKKLAHLSIYMRHKPLGPKEHQRPLRGSTDAIIANHSLQPPNCGSRCPCRSSASLNMGNSQR